MKKFEIDHVFPENMGVLRLNKPSQLANWVEKEENAWSWLREESLGQTPGDIQTVRNGVNSFINQMKSYAQQWENNPSDTGVKNNIKNILQSRDYFFIPSTSSQGVAIATIVKEYGILEGVAGLNAANDRAPNLSRQVFLRGALVYQRIIDGLHKNANAKSLNIFNEHVSSMQTEIARAVAEFDAKSAALARLISKHEDSLAQARHLQARSVSGSRRTSAKLAKNLRARLTVFEEECANRIKEIEDNYARKLALQKPVQYWKDKRKKHTRWASVAAIAFIAYLIALYCIGSAKLADSQILTVDFWKGVQIGTLGIIALIIGVAVALARIIYRLFLSQLHLSNDADERVTMVTTYLVLLEQGHAKEEFMSVVLARLFAPAADGIVKDDIGPIGLGDAITKNLFK